MAVVIRLIEWADGRPLNCAGQYIERVDVQAAPESDTWLVPTPKLSRARRWPNIAAAFETYREVLLSQPIRRDGQPNRPLTGITVEFLNPDIIITERANHGSETDPA
jgi:hypothetical protein